MVTWDAVADALGGGAPVIAGAPPLAASARADLAARGIAAVLTTSGSTGEGKRVMLSRAALIASAEATQQVVGRATWTCALPTDYVAGFMTLVRAHVAGTVPLIASSDLRDLAPAAGRNAISLVSTQLFRALRDPATLTALRRYDVLLVGGSAVGDDLLAEVRAAGLAPILTYGMSETCGGCVYDGLPLPGVGVRVEADGRIVLSGPQLFSGYLDDAAATASALVNGELLTRDRGEWRAGRLVVGGRIDSVVISGGVNVDLDEVQRALDGEAIPAAVVGVPDDEWGARIVLVAEPGRGLDEWRAALATRLGSAALPKQLVVVDRLPQTDRGKLDRAALLGRVEGTGHGDVGAVD